MVFALAQPLSLGSVGAAVFVLLAVGVTAMTAIVFVFWFVAMLVKGALLIFARLPIGADPSRAPALPPNAATPPAVSASFVCPDPVCRSVNPCEASFCRQCGRMFKRPDHA